MPAADGVDARARRVAARLLSARSRRAGGVRWARADVAGPAEGAGSPRHVTAGHPAGAARLAKALRSLEADGWVSLARVRRPGAPDAPPVDHLVIGPGGVVVIDSRAWVGRVEVSRGVVQQNGFWREQETAAVAHVAGCISALLLPQHRTAVHAVICITQHDLPEHLVAPGVHVVGVTGLARALRAMPHRLHPAEVLHLNTVLRQSLVDGEAPEQLTTAELDGTAHPGVVVGAHREPGLHAPDPAPRLFTVAGGLPPRAGGRSVPRSTARPAGRRQRPTLPWWRTPRVIVPRVLLAVLVIAAVVTLGPGLVRSFSEVVVDAPVVSVLPSTAGGDGSLSSATAPPAIVPPMWSGGTAPVHQIPPAATAHEQPLGSLAPIPPPEPPAARHGRGSASSS